MRVFGPRELQADIIGKGHCIGCGACTDLCPYFRSHRGKTAMLFPCTLEKGRCYAFCPKAEADLDELSLRFFAKPYDGSPLGSYLSIQVSQAGEKAGSGDFQAGGTVSVLMAFALAEGLIETAVLTDRDGLLPIPRLAKNAAEVYRCASSKYAAAPTLSALNQCLGESGGIGVVSTPCQALAVAKMRSNPLEKADFQDPVKLVMGLFCTWSLDYRSFQAFLASKTEVGKIRKVDIPPPPAEVMEVYGEDGKKEIPLAEVRKLVPLPCSYCLDMTAEFSDLSVGVLEGHPGSNTLIVRTEKGRDLVERAVRKGHLRTKKIPEESLKHLLWAAGNKKRRALAAMTAEGLFDADGGAKRVMVRFGAGAAEAIQREDKK